MDSSNLQRIFGILISVIIFFLFPIYITFEKRDDISYSLALKITYNFVENVRQKGYLTRNMYDSFVNELAVTGNNYDISMEHTKKRYDPIFYVYTDSNHSKIDYSLDYITTVKGNTYVGNDPSDSTKSFTLTNLNNGTITPNAVLSYKESNIVNTEKQIFDVFNSTNNVAFMTLESGAYSSISKIPLNPTQYGSDGDINEYDMSAGDDFTVKLKNKNTTIATIFFNALTLGANNTNNTRVFVNYGGTILNDADSKYKYASASVDNESMKIFTVPTTGKYKIELWGANGGDDDTYGKGGKGGYITGQINLTQGQNLYIYVGKSGVSSSAGASGGFNGGGNAGPSGSSGGGGGATDIRQGGTQLTDRILVAGGGGGAGDNHNGGAGGVTSYNVAGLIGAAGGNGISSNSANQTPVFSSYNGATLKAGGTSLNGNGTFGQGASHSSDGGGGGGGYYGGGAGDSVSGYTDNGGGGGSSFAASVILSGTMSTKVRDDGGTDGKCVITDITTNTKYTY